MRVFVVIECGHYIANGLLCNALGVHTDFKKAQKEMWECHAEYIKGVDSLDIITSSKDIYECTLVYKVGEQTERHFVFVEEREVED
jgi:hypothetical protein